jgi:hypothetical protein
MTLPNSFIERLPPDERDELIEFLNDSFDSLSPPEQKAFVIDSQAADTRAKIRKHGGLITEEQANERIDKETAPLIYEVLWRWAVKQATKKDAKNRDVAFVRDLEKYKETPQVAILKHFKCSNIVSVAQERLREKQEQLQQKQQH